MRVQANAGIGELGHVGAPDDDQPLVLQPRDGGGIGRGGRVILQYLRARGRHLASEVEDILRREGNAGKCRDLAAALPLQVHKVGRSARTLCIHRDEGARPFARRISDLRQRALDEIAGGGFAFGQLAGEFGEGLHR